MLCVPTPPFVRDALTALFGFPVPASFVAVLNALCHDCESAEAACERTDDALGWLLAGDERRYTQTPPELFPIAATCVDGGHFGYVIHAPELGASDYPIARFEPMDSGGVYLLGTSTFEAVETHLSTNIRDAQLYDWDSPLSHAWWPQVSTRLAELRIVPDPAKAGRNYDGDDGKPVLPTVPEGWRYVPCSDGVGVLAPAEKFHPVCSYSMDDRPNVDFVLEASMTHLADGFPATALWLLRECYWRTWTSATDAALCRAMIDTYHALGRPSLAAVVDRRIAVLR